jgi:hypothetical protein
MTAKEKLREAIEALSELEAEDTLAYIAHRRERDPVLEAFDNAALDDEPITDEEERAVEEGREAYSRGDTYTSHQIRQELGL